MSPARRKSRGKKRRSSGARLERDLHSGVLGALLQANRDAIIVIFILVGSQIAQPLSRQRSEPPQEVIDLLFLRFTFDALLNVVQPFRNGSIRRVHDLLFPVQLR